MYVDVDVAKSIAVDVCKGRCSEKLRKTFLEQVKKLDIGSCFGLQYEFPLHVGARYMITVNVCTSDGLVVNGACGILKKIYRTTTTNAVKLIWMEFNDETIGKLVKNSNNNWVPIERCVRQIKTKKGHSDVYVERRQFPITPAEAITIHKSQGATYDCGVAVHLEKYLAKSAVYVACSRVTKSTGLYLFGEPFKAPITSKKASRVDPIEEEIKSLSTQKSRQLHVPIDSILICQTICCRITYQNVESFRKHQNIIENDPQFMNSDLIVFVETWLNYNDLIKINNFTILYNLTNNLDDEKLPYGILCLKNNNSKLKFKFIKKFIQTVYIGVTIRKIQMLHIECCLCNETIQNLCCLYTIKNNS